MIGCSPAILARFCTDDRAVDDETATGPNAGPSDDVSRIPDADDRPHTRGDDD